MATEVKVTSASIEVRTVKLTKALLKQFRMLERVPQAWMDGDKVNLKYVVGWIHGSVLGDEFMRYTLFQNLKGDYYLFAYLPDVVKNECKQLYIV